MPIKLKGHNFVLPSILSLKAANIITHFIKVASAKEIKINPNWKDYYCYLTINQGLVKAGNSQRNTGAHFDGMQGVRYPDKFPVCHQYLISSSNPTIYYPNPFDFSKLDDNKDNFFSECDRQKDANKAIFAKVNCLYLQTAYHIHESPITREDCHRTFVRIEFSLKKFNRLGNSINPCLKTRWKYELQPIPSHLK